MHAVGRKGELSDSRAGLEVRFGVLRLRQRRPGEQQVEPSFQTSQITEVDFVCISRLHTHVRTGNGYLARRSCEVTTSCWAVFARVRNPYTLLLQGAYITHMRIRRLHSGWVSDRLALHISL